MKETKFTNGELNLLVYYIQSNEDEGWYFGNKEQFEKRRESIKRKIEKLRANL